MTVPAAILVLLLALDGPVGHGIPPVVTRFAGETSPPIQAIFARHPEDAVIQPEIVWFLDGDALGVPLGKSAFTPSSEAPSNPLLTPGHFLWDLPDSAKPQVYRGAIYQEGLSPESQPFATFRFVLFPADYLLEEWKKVAESDLHLTLIGPLPGLREFFQSRGIRFVEGRHDDLSSVDRNGMLVVDAEHDDLFVIPPGQARAVLVFSAPDRSWQSSFRVMENTDATIWTQRNLHLDFASDPLAQKLFLHLAEPLIQKSP